MWYGHPYCVFFPFAFFILVVLCFVVIRQVFFRRFYGHGGMMYGPRIKEGNPEDILKQRLAKGDITEEEYKHLRQVLKD